MSDLNLKTFDKLYPMIIHKYDELFDDQNANIMDRINTIVNYLNQVGKLTNDVVKDWNVVYQWVMNDGLTTDVNNKIEAMKANGELDTILQSVFNSIAGDKTTLHTTAKDTLVNAINEVDDLAKANQTNIGDLTTLTTADKDTIVHAINDNTTQLAQNAKHTPNTESVIFYNADPTKTTDSTQAFINAMQNYETVIVPTGDFLFNSTLTIQSSYKVQKIIGVGRDNSRLFFNSGTDGITNNKSGVIIEGVGIYGNGTLGTKGVKLLSPIQMKNFQVYSFDVGIDLSNQVHIVTSFFEKGTIAYNKSYGIKVISGGNWQNNAITFKELYMVKNGTDADTLTSNATTTNGDGMYISGGYAILIEDCVFEYNTGVGLRLDSHSYPLYGVTVTSPYFERNKYGQLFIDNAPATYSITGLTVIGDFYTDAGLTPVSNSLSNRQMYVTKPNQLLNNQSSNNMGQYSFAERNTKTRRANPLNAFPVNRMSDLAVDYPSNIVTYNGDSVFQITNSVTGQTMYSELMHIDPIYDYVFSYDVIKTSTTTSPNLLSYLYDNDSGSLISSSSTYLGGGSFGWMTKYVKVTGLSSSKVLRLYLNVEGTTPSDLQIYIKNIRLMPIIKNTALNSGATANRPTGIVAGTQFYDTTLNKPIWYNGTNWTDATGTTV